MQHVGVHLNIRFAEDIECMNIVIPAEYDFVVDMTVGLSTELLAYIRRGPVC